MIVAPKCNKKPGTSFLLLRESNHCQCAFVNGDRRADQCYARSFAVLNVDTGVVDQDEGTGSALEQDAARGARYIADSDGVHQPRAQYDAWAHGISREREHRKLGRRTPKTSGPNGVVRVASFKFHPNTGSDLGYEVRAHLFSCDGNAGHGPT